MSHTIELRNAAAKALERMRAQGFQEAQVTAVATRQDEVSIAHGEPSLLRSTDSRRLGLLGIVDGRKAATELTDLSDESVRQGVEALFASAKAAPRDEANQVSSGQKARIVQGPQEADVELLAEKARELLEFCRRETPRVNLVEAMVAHALTRSHTVTTGGTELETQVGHHSMGAFGTAREGKATSSFAATGGNTHELAGVHASSLFGMEEMLRNLEKSIHTRPVGGKFVGDVVLTPEAVSDFMGWFLGQLCDAPLIAGSSLYRDQVGQAVASPRLTLRSRFDAPGVAAVTMDGFFANPVTILEQGKLRTLTPSLYGSLKTRLPHVPTAAEGWELLAGDVPREKMVSDTSRGALVGRLSMGNPAANGDFAGVIKNSFLIEGGKVGHALSETMISGNVAQMLKDVVAVSRERLDTGTWLLPWIRIGGLHFS
jgi:PmbA protein